MTKDRADLKRARTLEFAWKWSSLFRRVLVLVLVSSVGCSSMTSKQKGRVWNGTPCLASPRPVKAKMSKSKIKTTVIVFFDIRGLVHNEFVPHGTQVLRRSIEKIENENFHWELAMFYTKLDGTYLLHRTLYCSLHEKWKLIPRKNTLSLVG